MFFFAADLDVAFPRPAAHLAFNLCVVSLSGLVFRHKYSQDTDMDASSSTAKAWKLRWDIRIGLLASTLAIAGLISSILRRNEEVFGSKFVATGLQKTLLIFAIGLACMTVAKSWRARRHASAPEAPRHSSTRIVGQIPASCCLRMRRSHGATC